MAGLAVGQLCLIRSGRRASSPSSKDSQRSARRLACAKLRHPASSSPRPAAGRPPSFALLASGRPAIQLPTAGLDSRPAGLGYQLRMARQPAGQLRSVPHHPHRGALSAIPIARCPASPAPRLRAMTTASAGGGARPQPCETCRLPQAAAQGRIAGIARALPRRARLPPRRTCRFCPHARRPPGGIASQPCPPRPSRPTPRSIRARREAAPHRLHEQWAAAARDWARGDAGRLPARLGWAAASGTDAAARHRRGGDEAPLLLSKRVP